MRWESMWVSHEYTNTHMHTNSCAQLNRWPADLINSPDHEVHIYTWCCHIERHWDMLLTCILERLMITRTLPTRSCHRPGSTRKLSRCSRLGEVELLAGLVGNTVASLDHASTCQSHCLSDLLPFSALFQSLPQALLQDCKSFHPIKSY